MAQKILIAEDETPIARALSLKLTSAGFTVMAVANGADAVAALTREPFDIMLLDLVMPEIDGFGVLEKMKTTMNAKTPVMVLTNLGQEEDKKRVGAYGVTEYFVKSNTELAAIVSRISTILAHGSHTE